MKLNVKHNNKIFLAMLAVLVFAFIGAARSENNTPARDEEGYWLLGTRADVEWFRDKVNNEGQTSMKAKLIADIDLEGAKGNEWVPIGYRTGSNPKIYGGIFDGQGHKISGLYINGDDSQNSNYKGLFGAGSYCTIKNLTVVGSVINVNRNAGGICGYLDGKSTISNCTSEVNVVGKENIGGICGTVSGAGDGARRAAITNCVNKGQVKGKNLTGGIVGFCDFACTITNCKNQGTVTGDWIVGGICGSTEDCTTIANCANSPDIAYKGDTVVTGDLNVGGICGTSSVSAEILDCLNEGGTTGRENVGGICGCASYAKFTNCVNKSSVTESTAERGTLGNLGGICGYMQSTEIFNCVNEATVAILSTWKKFCGGVGGVCGTIESQGTVENCFNTGKVVGPTSTGQSGGIAGQCKTYSDDIHIYLSNCGWTGNAAGAVLDIIGEGTIITDTREYTEAEIPATAAIITLDKLMIGDTKTALKFYPVKACNIETISNTLVSSDNAVAKINGYKVTGVAEGNATISGKLSGLYGSSTLDVTKSIMVADPSEQSNFRVVAEEEGGVPGGSIIVKLKLLLADLADLLVKEIKFCVMWHYNWLTLKSAEKSSIAGAKDPKVVTSGMVSFEISNPDGLSFNEGQYYDVGTMTFKIDNGTEVGSINDIYISSGTYTLSNGVVKTPATINTDLTVYQPVTAINITSSTGTTTVLVSETLQLNAEILPATAHTKDISWSSSDETVATVDANGLVTAKEISGKSATVTITASALDGSGVTGNIQLTVSRPDITGMSFAKKAYRVLAGNSQDLYAELSVVPEMALKPQATEITWTSDNPKITVDAYGKVTMASDAENVTGAVTAQYQNEKGQTVSCTATVTTERLSVNLNLATKLEGRTSGGGTGTNVENVEVYLYDSANNPLWNGSGTTDANGNVSFEIEADTLEEGKTVKLWIKGERYLAKLFTQTVTLSGSDWNVTMSEKLKAADANGDNKVNLTDFGILGNSFLKKKGVTGFDARADFNADDKVNLTDFGLLGNNFLKKGDSKPAAAVTMLMTAAANKGTLATAMNVLNTQTAKVAEEALASSTATDEETIEEEILTAVQNATGAELNASTETASSSNSSSSSNNSGSSSSSGGCNAGCGALALLFAIPLIFRKRKWRG